ncbi:glycosyltransferase family 4 protein [Silicimonas algicola]|nr:glycosyltransferase family 4 protein [Silicimonas algicola]
MTDEGRSRNVAIVAPHFPPSNLAGVHRARLLSQHLAEFGWRPIIVTTHWRHYEEELDWGLNSLVDPKLEVIHTRAAPTKPVRTIGDIGVRALPWHLAAIEKLRRANRLDFLLITVPSFYSSVLGQLAYRRMPLPFGIDYIDPWVQMWPPAEVRFSKAWFSYKLGERLEPWAVKNASLITGVASGYYQGVIERNPQLETTAVQAAMPYGFSSADFVAPSVYSQRPKLFDPDDGHLHLVYAGAMLPKAYSVLERLFEGLALLKRENPEVAKRFRLHFIGTGKSPNDRNGFNVVPVAERLGVSGQVREHPNRIGYLDVLAHLTKAFGILVLGSTEAHYTPSKVYQAVQSRRPVFAMLHHASTAVDVLRESRAGFAVTHTTDRLPSIAEVSAALQHFAVGFDYDADQVDWSAFDEFSARESASRLGRAMDLASAKFDERVKRRTQ